MSASLAPRLRLTTSIGARSTGGRWLRSSINCFSSSAAATAHSRSCRRYGAAARAFWSHGRAQTRAGPCRGPPPRAAAGLRIGRRRPLRVRSDAGGRASGQSRALSCLVTGGCAGTSTTSNDSRASSDRRVSNLLGSPSTPVILSAAADPQLTIIALLTRFTGRHRLKRAASCSSD